MSTPINTSTTLLPTRLILTLLSLPTALGPFLADWNATHIHNPRWPPHAKFHNGQTMSSGLMLGCLSLYYTWRRVRGGGGGFNVAAQMEDLFTATVFGTLYWVTLLTGILYPGTDWCDEEWRHLGTPQKRGAPVFVGVGWLGLGWGWWRTMGGRGLGRVKGA